MMNTHYNYEPCVLCGHNSADNDRRARLGDRYSFANACNFVIDGVESVFLCPKCSDKVGIQDSVIDV